MMTKLTISKKSPRQTLQTLTFTASVQSKDVASNEPKYKPCLDTLYTVLQSALIDFRVSQASPSYNAFFQDISNEPLVHSMFEETAKG